MFISEQKKKESIAEYLLYMWQMEDILRAYELDIDQVQKALVDPTNHSLEKKQEARQWYLHLIEQMKSEGIEEYGHLNINNQLLEELSAFHSELLKDAKEVNYIETYYKTLPFIKELTLKSIDKEVSEIETCFTALYVYLLLKLSKTEISSDTSSAITQISSLLRAFSERYNSQVKKEN